jgi:hypothetical protein
MGSRSKKNKRSSSKESPLRGGDTIAPSNAPASSNAPAQGGPSNLSNEIIRTLNPQLTTVVSSYPQSTIDSITNLITRIKNITDINGVTFASLSDATLPTAREITPKLSNTIEYVYYIKLDSTYKNAIQQYSPQSLPPERLNLINILKQFSNDQQIIEFYEIMIQQYML